MLDTRAKDLLKIGDTLFSKKSSLDSLRQEIAKLYYYERADFTGESALGTDYAAGSMTSYPHFARRELGGLFPALLRTGAWFGIHIRDQKLDERKDIRATLEWMTATQMAAMRDPDSAFAMATDEADDDLITFGDTVVSVEVDYANTSLLYRNWHLRDCAWLQDERRKVDWMCRKWKPAVRLLKRKFKNTAPDLEKKYKDDPDCQIDCRHIVVRRDDYGYDDGKRSDLPFISLYIDVENQHVMEETPMAWFPYVVAPWGTISGTQYGYSPAIVLPDARSANTVRAILLDAGETAINPPLVAVQDAIRSDIALNPGGVTWVDIEYDERLGEALRPVSSSGNRALPFGIDMDVMFKDAIANSFFLNKLVLPPDIGKDAKTAYEIQKRVQEHIRSSSALFEPIDANYSSSLCEATFHALMSVGTFGPRDPRTGGLVGAPPELAGKTIEYQFTNPIRETEKEMRAQRFIQGIQIYDAVSGIDPKQIARIAMAPAFEDALKSIGWPAEWIEDEQAYQQTLAAMQQQQQAQELAQTIGTGAAIAKDGAQATKFLADSGITLG